MLLRRILYTNFVDIHKEVPPDIFEQYKSQVIVLIQKENMTLSLKKKVCDVASELARNLIDESGNNHWPQFLQFLFQCVNSQSPALKECALIMFA